MGDERQLTSFGRMDAEPPDLRVLMRAALARMAASPQIRGVRAVASAALAAAPGERVLDAGCGAGEVARALAASGAEVWAVDASTETLAHAEQQDDGAGVRYRVGDVAALAFADGEFDAVRCERVLQHVADPDAAIAELARVTRPGGRVVLIDTDWLSLAVDGLPEEVVEPVRAFLLGRPVLHHITMGRTLRRRMVAAGLVDVVPQAVPLVFPDPDQASTVLGAFSRSNPVAGTMVPEGSRDAWFDAIEAAAVRGDFLAVLTMWVVTGVMP